MYLVGVHCLGIVSMCMFISSVINQQGYGILFSLLALWYTAMVASLFQAKYRQIRIEMAEEAADKAIESWKKAIRDHKNSEKEVDKHNNRK